MVRACDADGDGVLDVDVVDVCLCVVGMSAGAGAQVDEGLALHHTLLPLLVLFFFSRALEPSP
jgi:hypothetical protein